MVQVRVRHREQVEPLHAELAQCRQHRIASPIELGERASRIYEQRTASSLYQHRVPLPDVEHDQPRRRRRQVRRRGRGGAHADGQSRDDAHPGALRAKPQQRDEDQDAEGGGVRRVTRREPARELDCNPLETAGERCHDTKPVAGRARSQRRRIDERRQRGEQRRREQQPADQRYRDEVRRQRPRRGLPETPGDERSRCQDRGRAGAHGSASRPSEDQCRRREERELGAAAKERSRLEPEDHERGQRQARGPARRAPEPDAGAECREQHPRAAHRDVEPRHQRLHGRPRERQRERDATRVATARQPRPPAQQRASQRVHPGCGQREVQARYREEMRHPEPRERGAHLPRQPSPLAQSQRGEQRSARAGRRQRVRRTDAPAQQRSERARCRVGQAHDQRRVQQSRDHARPFPKSRVCVAPSTAAARIAHARARSYAHPRAHAIPGDQTPEQRGRGEVRRIRAQPQPRGKRCAVAIQHPRVDQVVACAGGAAPHACDLGLKRHVARPGECTGARVGRKRLLQVERGRAEHAQRRQRRAQCAAPRRQRAGESHHRQDQRGRSVEPAAVGDQDAQKLGQQEPGEDVHRRDPGTGSAPRLPGAFDQCSRSGRFSFTQVFMR